MKVLVGDITTRDVDAIVNAANPSLMGGGGVDGAIHAAGGRKILEECKDIRRHDYPGGLPPGQAVITSAGKLPADYVIHAVGPAWKGGERNEEKLLAATYRNSLDLAASYACKSVAFPAISTGVYGFPKDRAAVVAFDAIEQVLRRNTVPTVVELVFFSEDDASAFVQAVEANTE
jgi:O-acetyl-ADP-ribose deacetylase (regulator of RNase III)